MSRNTFSEKSSDYALARPQYPDELFKWIEKHCRNMGTAWDCACGNGQAAVGLSPYFDAIQATDISSEQIVHAIPRKNIGYSLRSAENSGFADNTFDLIVVAQALHWFDYGKFWKEVSRVGCPDALFAGWGYSWLNCTPEIDNVLIKPFREAIAPFWAKNNRVLWDGYRTEDVCFPFERIQTPIFEITVEWTITEIIYYMKTWSAYKLSCQSAEAVSKLDEIITETLSRFPGEEKRLVYMPLSIIVGLVR